MYRVFLFREYVDGRVGREVGTLVSSEIHFCSEKVKQMRFTGAVTRYRDLEYVLKMIEKTRDISFVDSETD